MSIETFPARHGGVSIVLPKGSTMRYSLLVLSQEATEATIGEEAMAWAEKCPGAQYGAVEIRPSAVVFHDGSWHPAS